eukprot:scaffold2028_cov181-Ochromonas_danica.AAC.14
MSAQVTQSDPDPIQIDNAIAKEDSVEEEELPVIVEEPPIEKVASKNAKRATFDQTFSNADGYDKLLMFLGTAGGIATGASIPVFNVLFGQIINALNRDPDSFSQRVNTLCIAFLIVAVANLLTGFLQVYCWSATGERQTQRFRERYVNALLSQEIGWFDTIGAGQLNTKVAEVIGKIQDGTGRKIGDMIQYITQVIASFVVAFYLCWQLTVVLLAAIPCLGFSGAYMIQAINAATHQSFAQYAQAGAVAQETIGSVRTVSAFNLQPTFIAKYRVFILEALRVGILKGTNLGIGNGAVFGVAFLTYALGFWYGGRLVAHDVERGCTGDSCINGGVIISVFFSTIMGSIALGQVAPPMTAFVTAQSSIAVIFELLERKPLIDGLSNEGLVPEHRLEGEIALKDVSFAYPSRPDILVCDHMSLKIAHGETVALVGASGCGKSTIINLLLRFYDPTSGGVFLKDHDLRSLNIKYLRSLIGYVGQEPVLFAGTIGDNISYGLDPQEKASMSREHLLTLIEGAAKAANAHDFIMNFPQGYETDVGGSGSSLSGGQKQRIAIARALIKKPAILLLDEATSALDINSEKVVQASIDRLSAAKTQTTIIVAHRLSTIVNADRICVLKEGHIVEQGMHKDLLQIPSGVYADLVRMQMMSGEDDVSGDVDEGIEQVNEEQKRSDVVASKLSVELEENEIAELDVEKGGNDTTRLCENAENEVALVKSEGEPEADPKEVPVSKEEKKVLTRRIFAMIGQYPGLVTLGLLGWGLMLAKTQKSFFLSDPDEIRDRARLYAFLYIMLAGVAFFSSTAMFYGVIAVGEHVATEMRSTLFESYFHHSVAFFDDPAHSVGTLTTQLAEETRFVSKALGEGFARQLQALCTLLVALGLGFSASWRIAFIVLATFPLNIAASAIQMAAVAGMQYDNEDDEKAIADEKAKGGKASQGAKEKETKKSKNAKKEEKPPSGGGGQEGSTMAGSHSAVLGTAFTNMRTVSAFSMQHKVAQHYAKLTQEVAERRTGRSIVAGLGFGGSNTCLFLTYALLFWVGAQFIKNGTLDFEELMSSIMTLMLGAVGLGQALNDMGDQVKGVATAKRIFQAIDSARDSKIDGLSSHKGLVPKQNKELVDCDLSSVDPSELYELQGKIELRNLCFHYPTRPDVAVCKGYNLTISAGEVVAFVGPSGSGKSTVINLLLRFYDPDEGAILVDDLDIKDLNLRYLRSQIGYVGQEPVLFSGTVEDNLSYGRFEVNFSPLMPLTEAMTVARDQYRRDAEPSQCLRLWHMVTHPQQDQPVTPYTAIEKQKEQDEGDVETGSVPADMVAAAKFAHAHTFISHFSDGYKTTVSAMGSGYMISGGQKQRISVARAMLKRPKILLLDEATSALDAQSEHLIQQSIDALTQRNGQGQKPGLNQNRPTVIIVAHRLSTIVNADRIVVIDKGEIKEVGPHEELMTKPDGIYRQLYLKQSQGRS